MACSKYTLTNTGTTSINFNYRRCDDSMWEYQVNLDPNQTKNIWLINGTYQIAQLFAPSVNLINDGVYPLTPTPTPTTTPTPTVTPTPTQPPLSLTPTPTVTTTSTTTPTPTLTVTPTNTVTPTSTLTPTPSVTPTLTPTNTITPTITPTNTETPTQTPTNTPTPSHTPTVETIQIANSTWTSFSQSDFLNWLISGATTQYNYNNNPNAVITAFNNNSGDITASVYNVTNINIAQGSNFISISQLPNSLTLLNTNFVNLPSLPTLSATSLTSLSLYYNTVITSIPKLPSTLVSLGLFGDTNLTSLPELSGTSLQNLLLDGAPITSIPALPNTLGYLTANNCTSLSSFPTLPGSLTTLTFAGCSFTTPSLDSAVASFLGSGTLPKTEWDSSGQTTLAQPSSAEQIQLSNTSNVVTATY